MDTCHRGIRDIHMGPFHVFVRPRLSSRRGNIRVGCCTITRGALGVWRVVPRGASCDNRSAHHSRTATSASSPASVSDAPCIYGGFDCGDVVQRQRRRARAGGATRITSYFMKYAFGKTVVVALGGSVVFPDDVDWKLLRAFRAGIKKWSRKRRFIVVVGGGRLCRMYLEAAAKVVRLTDRDKDWVGIHATRANAHPVRAVLHDVADPRVIDERFKMKQLKRPVTVAAGWKPGWSTDFVSVALARDFGAKEVIIAGKPSHVHNKDNRKHADAK